MNRYTVEFKSPGGKDRSCSVRAYSASGALVLAMEEHNDLRHYPDRITRVIKEESNG
ncbi:hypothetical protein SCRES1_gp55 [Synechococcus phage S-CRES1]|nr:hypothetical protein SCRES1_gp55 [Synechococcus phage S-CRES1]